jgi:hypothetical protein
MGLCCFCDNPAVADRPGAPLCATCWESCERKAREAKPAAISASPGAEELLVREAQRLAIHARHLAGFVGIAAIGAAPKGTTTH